MRSNIKYSAFSIALTAIILIALFAGCIATVRNNTAFFILLSIYIFLFLCGLLYGAGYIKVTSEHVVMGSVLKSRKILMRNIESVELFQPTMGAMRILGSSGFMGYWGIFREGDIGRYFGFYGKASDCFLIRMKNGDKYVLGCENPAAMVDYIKSQID